MVFLHRLECFLSVLLADLVMNINYFMGYDMWFFIGFGFFESFVFVLYSVFKIKLKRSLCLFATVFSGVVFGVDVVVENVEFVDLSAPVPSTSSQTEEIVQRKAAKAKVEFIKKQEDVVLGEKDFWGIFDDIRKEINKMENTFDERLFEMVEYVLFFADESNVVAQGYIIPSMSNQNFNQCFYGDGFVGAINSHENTEMRLIIIGHHCASQKLTLNKFEKKSEHWLVHDVRDEIDKLSKKLLRMQFEYPALLEPMPDAISCFEFDDKINKRKISLLYDFGCEGSGNKLTKSNRYLVCGNLIVDYASCSNIHHGRRGCLGGIRCFRKAEIEFRKTAPCMDDFIDDSIEYDFFIFDKLRRFFLNKRENQVVALRFCHDDLDKVESVDCKSIIGVSYYHPREWNCTDYFQGGMGARTSSGKLQKVDFIEGVSYEFSFLNGVFNMRGDIEFNIDGLVDCSLKAGCLVVECFGKLNKKQLINIGSCTVEINCGLKEISIAVTSLHEKSFEGNVSIIEGGQCEKDDTSVHFAGFKHCHYHAKPDRAIPVLIPEDQGMGIEEETEESYLTSLSDTQYKREVIIKRDGTPVVRAIIPWGDL